MDRINLFKPSLLTVWGLICSRFRSQISSLHRFLFWCSW